MVDTADSALDAPIPRASSNTAPLVSREPMHGQILPHLRMGIVTGRWKAGERLPEPALCQEYGVSRTPLRDALKFLEAEGLVALLPHVGAVVTEASVEEIAEKMEVLVALELQAVYRVAAECHAETVAQITALHERMRNAAEISDADTYFRLNDDFHRAIVNGANNRSLSDMHEKIMWHVHRARHLANEHEPFSRNAAVHHQSIVDAIAAGDPDRACREMRRHLLEVTAIITGNAAAL